MSADPPVSLPPHPSSASRTPVTRLSEEPGQTPLTAAEQPGLVRDERRRHERAVVDMPVHVVTPGGILPCLAENLSAGGALLSGAPVLEPGTDLVVVLRLRGHPWHVRARVVRVQEAGSASAKMAVCFPGILAKVQDLIQSYVLTQLRKGARAS